MRDTVYLVMDSGGVRKMTKRQPYLEPGEVAINVRVEVENSFFRMPFVSANLTVGEEHLIRPEVDVSIEEAEQPNGKPLPPYPPGEWEDAVGDLPE